MEVTSVMSLDIEEPDESMNEFEDDIEDFEL